MTKRLYLSREETNHIESEPPVTVDDTGSNGDSDKDLLKLIRNFVHDFDKLLEPLSEEDDSIDEEGEESEKVANVKRNGKHEATASSKLSSSSMPSFKDIFKLTPAKKSKPLPINKQKTVKESDDSDSDDDIFAEFEKALANYQPSIDEDEKTKDSGDEANQTFRSFATVSRSKLTKRSQTRFNHATSTIQSSHSLSSNNNVSPKIKPALSEIKGRVEDEQHKSVSTVARPTAPSMPSFSNIFNSASNKQTPSPEAETICTLPKLSSTQHLQKELICHDHSYSTTPSKTPLSIEYCESNQSSLSDDLKSDILLRELGLDMLVSDKTITPSIPSLHNFFDAIRNEQVEAPSPTTTVEEVFDDPEEEFNTELEKAQRNHRPRTYLGKKTKYSVDVSDETLRLLATVSSKSRITERSRQNGPCIAYPSPKVFLPIEGITSNPSKVRALERVTRNRTTKATPIVSFKKLSSLKLPVQDIIKNYNENIKPALESVKTVEEAQKTLEKMQSDMNRLRLMIAKSKKIVRSKTKVSLPLTEFV